MSKNGDRELAYIENLAIGLDPVPAMINAGYTKRYAQCYAKRKLNNPNFISRLAKYVEKFPEHRATLAKTRLPKLFSLENDFYEKCQDDPELYAKYSKISERDYKLAGLLKDEIQVQAIVPVNIAIQVQTAITEQQTLPDSVKTIEIEDTNTNDNT